MFPLLQTYDVFANTTAETASTSLLKSDKVNVDYKLREVSGQPILDLSIAYDTKTENLKQKTKFRFVTADNKLLSFDPQTGWQQDKSDGTLWFIQSNWQTKSSETLSVPLPVNTKEINVEIQLDQQTTKDGKTEVQNNQLSSKEQGIYKIIVPEMTTQQTQQASSASTQTAQPAMTARMMMTETQSTDDFNTDYYIKDDKGIYPKNGTNKYLGSDSKDSVYINNFGFNNNLNSGYQEVKNPNGTKTLFKKTISPTDKDGEFQVQLDMLGQTLTTKQKIDLVIVLDKSGSMGYQDASRWKQVKDSIATFSNNFLNTADKKNQMSLISFQGQDTKPSVDVSIFGNSAFTYDFNDITNSTILKNKPNNVGTPTFVGFDAGLEVLTNSISGTRSDAKKIILTITDGKPTFFPTTNYKTDSFYKVYDNPKTDDPTISRYNLNNSKYFSGNGDVGQNSDILANGLASTTNYINRKLELNSYGTYIRFAIEIGQENNKDFMKLLGKDGVYTSSNNDISALLANINSKINSYYSLEGGTFTDLIGSDFTYVKDSLKQETITGSSTSSINKVGNTTKFTQPTISNKEIKANNLILSSTDPKQFQGYRITYKLAIDNKDGLFHQANGQTTLKDAAGKIVADYIVPSARYQTRTITAKSDIKGAEYTLERLNSDGTWKTIEIKQDSSNTNTVNFTTVPARDKAGILISYRVKQSAITGYDVEQNPQVVKILDDEVWKSDNPTVTFTNTKANTTISFTKVDESNKPMSGVKFTLMDSKQNVLEENITSNSTGVVTFKTYPIGTYILRETATNLGYKLMADKTITIKNNNGLKVYNNDGSELITIQNEPLKTTVNFATYDINDTSYQNKFNESEVQYDVKDMSGNKADLTNLSYGRYQFTQTKTKTDYQVLGETIYFEVKKDGTVVQTDKDGKAISSSGQATFEFTKSPDNKANNTLNIKVLNIQKGQLPATGGDGHFFTNRLAVILVSLGFVASLVHLGLQFRGRKR